MTANQIAYQSHLENVRSNQAREHETNRSNLVNEGLTRLRDAETKRANQAREVETNRSNLAKEMENHRTNVANENLTARGQNITGLGNLLNATTKVSTTAAQLASNERIAKGNQEASKESSLIRATNGLSGLVSTETGKRISSLAQSLAGISKIPAPDMSKADNPAYFEMPGLTNLKKHLRKE